MIMRAATRGEVCALALYFPSILFNELNVTSTILVIRFTTCLVRMLDNVWRALSIGMISLSIQFFSWMYRNTICEKNHMSDLFFECAKNDFGYPVQSWAKFLFEDYSPLVIAVIYYTGKLISARYHGLRWQNNNEQEWLVKSKRCAKAFKHFSVVKLPSAARLFSTWRTNIVLEKVARCKSARLVSFVLQAWKERSSERRAWSRKYAANSGCVRIHGTRNVHSLGDQRQKAPAMEIGHQTGMFSFRCKWERLGMKKERRSIQGARPLRRYFERSRKLEGQTKVTKIQGKRLSVIDTISYAINGQATATFSLNIF